MTTDVAADAPPQSSERYHALDAVRAGALLLGVVFHAVLSFMEPPIWVVVDESTSPVMSSTYFTLHIFRLTVFFLMAGFFGRLLLHRRGTGAFARDRAKRILLPLVVFWPVVMVTTVMVIFWAAAQRGEELPGAEPFTLRTFPLTHLWFLWYLILFYAGVLLVRALMGLVDSAGGLRSRVIDPIVKAIVSFELTPFVLGAPLCVALYFADWKMWFGIPAAENGLIPNTPALIGYATAFGFGWLLHRQPDLLRVWEQRSMVTLPIAVVLTGVCLWIAGPYTSQDIAPHTGATLGYAALYTVTIWAWTMGLIGMALRYLSGHNPAVRYVADASYWIYIAHLPLVMALQAALAPLGLPWPVKYVLVLAVAFPLLLLSYRYLVRHTFLGAMLNGRRHPRPSRPVADAPELAPAQ